MYLALNSGKKNYNISKVFSKSFNDGFDSSLSTLTLAITPPPPPCLSGALIRTLLCTCSKAAIPAHQFIREEAKKKPGDWI